MGEYLIKRGDSEAMVFALGGTVTNFKVKGKEIFYPWRNIDDKERGGCFMCAPWIGLSPREQKKHGYLRGMKYVIASISNNAPDSIELIFGGIGHERYPWVLKYVTTATILFDGSLCMTLSITRMGDGIEGMAPILPGFHPFFACQDTSKVRVSVLNDRFHGFSEKAQSIPLEYRIIRIEMPERKLEMEFNGDFSWLREPQMVFWTDATDKYACVEPIIQEKRRFESPEGYYLGEGESMKLSVLFRVLQ